MDKIDFKKKMKPLYSPNAKEVTSVIVPEMNFIIVDGMGDPNTAQEYTDALEALYGVSYTLKFMLKKGKKSVDYTVPPLEGLWWADDMTQFIKGNKDLWKWTAMIMQPEYVTAALFHEALEQVAKKKQLPAIPKLRFEKFSEGTAAQILYIGPYSDEGPTIERIHQFIFAQGGKLSGKHHEIYLSDPRKTAPLKLKTIIRQPYKEAL
jgi:hypothetical protein